ncbi:MAG TPA: SRPBCC domain-containing protein [Rhizomicrobium sp.]
MTIKAMLMRGAVLAVGIALAAPAQAAVSDGSYVDAGGARVLRETVTVDAPRDAVWRAFTTSAGMARWTVPVVQVTPGNGGLIEFALRPDGRIGDADNVRNRIDVFLPDELLVFHNEFVPAGGPFDPATFGTVRTLLSFDAAEGGRTRVTQTVVGFGAGANYDRLYAHLKDGNAEYLAALADSFARKN